MKILRTEVLMVSNVWHEVYGLDVVRTYYRYWMYV